MEYNKNCFGHTHLFVYYDVFCFHNDEESYLKLGIGISDAGEECLAAKDQQFST